MDELARRGGKLIYDRSSLSAAPPSYPQILRPNDDDLWTRARRAVQGASDPGSILNFVPPCFVSTWSC